MSEVEMLDTREAAELLGLFAKRDGLRDGPAAETPITVGFQGLYAAHGASVAECCDELVKMMAPNPLNGAFWSAMMARRCARELHAELTAGGSDACDAISRCWLDMVSAAVEVGFHARALGGFDAEAARAESLIMGLSDLKMIPARKRRLARRVVESAMKAARDTAECLALHFAIAEFDKRDGEAP